MTVLAVAHRAGNDLAALAAARALGAHVLEADVHTGAGGVVLHHLARLGPLPWSLDQPYRRRWRLVARSVRQLGLDELLDAAAETGLLLDLKSPDVGPAAAAIVAARTSTGPVLVCGNGRAMAAFRGVPDVHRLLSAGDATELAQVQEALRSGPPADGVSVHVSLLTPAVVERLLARVPRVLAWPVNDRRTLAVLLDRGVNGVISDDADVLRAVVALGR